MRRAVIAVALIAMLVGLAWVSPCRAAAPLAVVRKVAETFDEAPWPVDRWSRAAGASRVVDERPPDVPGGKALEFEARFSGGGFEHLAVMPREPLVVPGRLRTVTVRAQRTDARYPLVLTFKDGWGRSQVGPTKLEVSLAKGDATGWQTTTFRVPDDWVQPLTIAGFQTHNWSAQDAKNVVRFRVDHLEVETDLADVDPATGALKTWQPEPNPADPKKALAACPAAPLVSVAFSTGEVSNVFSRTEPAVTVSLRNWRAAALGGRLTCRVLDAAGGETGREERDVSVDAPVVLRVPLAAPRFGLYTLEAALVLADGTRRTERMTFARIPPEQDLSAARKRASPYGLNVHGGSDKHVIDPFRKAGIVWFRDYAFSYEWMLRAKGKDRRYDGWPWYPALVNRYTDAGVMLLPCLMKSIGPPKIEGGKAAGPDRAWVREIADIVLAFPQITYWELDNEYMPTPRTPSAGPVTGPTTAASPRCSTSSGPATSWPSNRAARASGPSASGPASRAATLPRSASSTRTTTAAPSRRRRTSATGTSPLRATIAASRPGCSSTPCAIPSGPPPPTAGRASRGSRSSDGTTWRGPSSRSSSRRRTWPGAGWWPWRPAPTSVSGSSITTRPRRSRSSTAWASWRPMAAPNSSSAQRRD